MDNNISKDIKVSRKGMLLLAIGEILVTISAFGLLANIRTWNASRMLIYGLLIQVPAFILIYIGCRYLKQYHAYFSYSGVIALASIVLAVLSVIFPLVTEDGWASMLGTLLDAFVDIFHVIIAYYYIRGIRDCFFKLKNDKMTGFCNYSFFIFVSLIVIVFVLEIIGNTDWIKKDDTLLMTFVFLVIGFTAIAHIYLIVFLFKCRSVIGKNIPKNFKGIKQE